MIEVNGKNRITAKIVCDSISTSGKRITTFEVEHHRWILAEINKHRMLSNNYQSSRAVPVSKIIDQVISNPATPVTWGKNQAGMQAVEECNDKVFMSSTFEYLEVGDAWKKTAEQYSDTALSFSESGYHKQIVNRLLEPFMMVKGVITATEYDNFFYLRRHKDAQPELRELADCMWQALKQSTPKVLSDNEWHLPYVNTLRDFNGKLLYILSDDELPKDNDFIDLEYAKKVSAAACAQVSFRKLDLTEETVERVYSKLINGEQPHSVCLEHSAKPMCKEDYRIQENSWEDLFNEPGVTHVDKEGNFWSGNFKGWIQNRKLLPNEYCKNMKINEVV